MSGVRGVLNYAGCFSPRQREVQTESMDGRLVCVMGLGYAHDPL